MKTMKPKLHRSLTTLASFVFGFSVLSAAGAELEPLDCYRLCRVRDAAVKKQDLRAIEKLVETEGLVRKESGWTAQRTAQLQKVISELEARAKIETVTSVPADLKPQDYAFAVPRRELLDVRFAGTEQAEAKSQSLDVYAPAGGKGHPIIVWLHGGGMKGGEDSYAGWDATGGYLLAYAMPLKKLYLTCKKAGAVPQLDAAAAQSLIVDGRGWSNNDRHSFYDALSDDRRLWRTWKSTHQVWWQDRSRVHLRNLYGERAEGAHSDYQDRLGRQVTQHRIPSAERRAIQAAQADSGIVGQISPGCPRGAQARGPEKMAG